ncbi:MAG: hypothetical protein IK081_12750 [Lachnospiraceae bacterium]|nr:hypothetical protein [Lachnospiraceae bacterium]
MKKRLTCQIALALSILAIVCCGITIYWVHLEMEFQITSFKLDLQAERNREMLADEIETYYQIMDRHGYQR